MHNIEKPTILVVDDDDAARYATARVIRNEGYPVMEAATGGEALEKAASGPDLVVLDVNLPDISGFEVCRKLKADPKTASIAVLHLSATFLDTEFKVKGLDFGAGGYLTQPVEPPVLLATIKALLRMKRAEQALREKEDLYRDLVEHSRALIYTHDFEGRILSANLWASKVLGMERDRLLKMNVRDILAPEVKDRFEAYLETLRKDGAAKGIMRIRTESGERRLWQYHNTVRSEGIAVPIVRGVAFDITEFKMIEASLRRSERLLNETQAISKTGGWEYDVKHRRITWTDEVYRIHGVQKDYDPNETAKDIRFYVEEDRPVLEQAFLDAVNKGESYDLELRFHAADGNPKWVRTIGKPVVQDCRVTKVVGTITDITDRKHMEEALRESEALFRQLFEKHAAVKLLLDPEDGRILDANEAAVAFYGWSREELRRLRIWDINTLSPAHIKAEMEKVRARERIYFEFKHRRADGSVRDVAVYSSKIESAGKDLLHSIIHDITDRKRAEAELTERMQELQRWHNVMLDREDRVLELKREVNELLARAGEPPRYPSALPEESDRASEGSRHSPETME